MRGATSIREAHVQDADEHGLREFDPSVLLSVDLPAEASLVGAQHLKPRRVPCVPSEIPQQAVYVESRRFECGERQLGVSPRRLDPASRHRPLLGPRPRDGLSDG